MGLYTLVAGVLKYFLIFRGFVLFDSDPLGHSFYGAFVHFWFSLSAHVIDWQECWLSTPVSCDHGIVHLDCWSIKIFSHFGGVLSALILILWGFRPMVLLSIFAFLCPPMWSHDENVDCPHMYHVIKGSYTLIVGVLKYFLIFGGFVRFDSDTFGLSSCSAFFQFCFSLSYHVIAWREFWLSTLVSVDHGIVHFGCWSIKIFSHFGGFCPLWFWSFGAFVLWCFGPFLLFSVHRHDCMMRNVDYPHLYHVIMGSYILIVGVLNYFLIFGGFVRFDSDPLRLSSYGAFCQFLLFSVCPCDRMMRMLIVHTCIRWSWDCTP